MTPRPHPRLGGSFFHSELQSWPSLASAPSLLDAERLRLQMPGQESGPGQVISSCGFCGLSSPLCLVSF